MESKRPQQEVVAMNRISQLPDQIILKILSFLSAKDVIRASLLSKKWLCICSNSLFTRSKIDLKSVSTVVSGGSVSRVRPGRNARLQLAAVLDEFWGQLFDFHGQLTEEAKKNKFDLLLVDPHLRWFYSNIYGEAFTSLVSNSQAQLLESLRCCIVKILKLEGSDWLFKENDVGGDEHLIDLVAAKERSSLLKKNDMHCGDGCVWKPDLLISFGVWCIHRILDLSLMESKPNLWGKYTYVLNRLQGIIEPAFSKPRRLISPCLCLQHSNVTNAAKPATTGSMVLDMIKDVMAAIDSRKGRSGTVAGLIMYPKGKENLLPVLKRYRRRLSNDPIGNK